MIHFSGVVEVKAHFESVDKRMGDDKKKEKEAALQGALLSIKERYGKNAVLRGESYLPGATQRERNAQVGGHKA